MRAEPGFLERHIAAVLCGVGTFVLVALLGSIGAGLMVDHFSRSVRLSAGNDVSAIGTSVAGALAQQFERAASYGIPLDRLRDVQAYLARTADEIPGVARIVVRLADGREIRGTSDDGENGDAERETVFAPIIAGGLNFGQVEVLTDASELTGPLDEIDPLALAAVAAISLLAALAAMLVGRVLDGRRAEMLAHLLRNADGDFRPGAVRALRGTDASARTFRMVHDAEDGVLEQRGAVLAYAEELLAVDFDDHLRPRIEQATAGMR